MQTKTSNTKLKKTRTNQPYRQNTIIMKKTIVTTGFIILVFRNGSFYNIFTEGTYWLRASDVVEFHDISLKFESSINLNTILLNKDIASKLIVKNVADNHISLLHEDGNLKSVLTPGKHAFWKNATEYTFIDADLSEIEIGKEIKKNTLRNSLLAPYIREVNVEVYEEGLLYVDGEFVKILEKGNYLFWRNITQIVVSKTDMRQKQLEVSGQEILTKDKASLRINFFAQYHVSDIVKALNENKEFEKQLYVLIQLALREFVGTLTLDEILGKKESVSDYVIASVQEKATQLGVKINSCGVRDIILPGDIKEIMNQVLVAQKTAQANIITRREETASTRSLLNTAKLMEDNAMLFKLKEMEFVEKIADNINSISLSGGGQVVEQLKGIFSSSNK